MKRRKIQAATALALALALLVSVAAGAGTWKVAEENIPRFRELFSALEDATAGSPAEPDRTEALLEEIRGADPDDGDVAKAVADHWRAAVLDGRYRMFAYRGEEKAETLARSGLDFGKRHAFVVLGYQLQDGEMTAELVGRCEAAAAAARAFPESMLFCTGGVTGPNNPQRHTEAGMMKDYLVRECGIDVSRIYTDTEAMTTADNAVNVLGMMELRRVDSYTLVTSDYHQRWAQILFNAVAAAREKGTGYRVCLVGNYNYQARPGASRMTGCLSALSQAFHMLTQGIDTGGP